HQPSQVNAVHVLHHQNVSGTDRTCIKGVDYVRVLELTDDLNFAIEAGDHVRIGKQLLPDQLQSNRAVHLLMLGLEHLAHSTFTAAFQEAIRTQHQVLSAALEQLIDLVCRQPTALQQLLTQSARVRKAFLERSNELLLLRRGQ